MSAVADVFKSIIVNCQLSIVNCNARHSVSVIAPFDLHVLGTPPAFVLSQDQTLYLYVFITKPVFGYNHKNRAFQLFNACALCYSFEKFLGSRSVSNPLQDYRRTLLDSCSISKVHFRALTKTSADVYIIINVRACQ